MAPPMGLAACAALAALGCNDILGVREPRAPVGDAASEMDVAAQTGGAIGAGGASGGGGAGGQPGRGSGGESGSGGTNGSGGARGSGGVPGSDSGGESGSGGTNGSGGARGSGGMPGSGGGAGGNGPPRGTGGAPAGTGGGAGSGGRTGTGGAGGACGAAPCAGCCRSGACLAGRSDDACGSGGESCRFCDPCHPCSAAGQCELDLGTPWDVVCSSAQISTSTGQGAAWDPPDGLPDGLCQLGLQPAGGAAMVVGTTYVLPDRYNPTWNQSVLAPGTTVTAAMLLSPDVTWIVTVRDNDGSLTAFDPVCETSFTPTAANLRNGTLAFSNVQSCTSLRLTFVCAAP